MSMLILWKAENARFKTNEFSIYGVRTWEKKDRILKT